MSSFDSEHNRHCHGHHCQCELEYYRRARGEMDPIGTLPATSNNSVSRHYTVPVFRGTRPLTPPQNEKSDTANDEESPSFSAVVAQSVQEGEVEVDASNGETVYDYTRGRVIKYSLVVFVVCYVVWLQTIAGKAVNDNADALSYMVYIFRCREMFPDNDCYLHALDKYGYDRVFHLEEDFATFKSENNICTTTKSIMEYLLGHFVLILFYFIAMGVLMKSISLMNRHEEEGEIKEADVVDDNSKLDRWVFFMRALSHYDPMRKILYFTVSFYILATAALHFSTCVQIYHIYQSLYLVL